MAIFAVHKVQELPSTLDPHAVYAVKGSTDTAFSLFITDATAIAVPLAQGAGAYWIDLCTKPLASNTATPCTSPVVGSVYTHVLNGVNIYRLVPSVYAPSDDVFYNAFSGGVCSGKIVGRAD